MGKYKRTLQELKTRAILNWPPELIAIAGEASILPLLLKTQDKFISVLTLADSHPNSWEKLVDISENMPGNLFLKHLMILSDLGGEALNKYTPVNRYFRKNRMEYIWNAKQYYYDFKVIHKNQPLTN